MKLILVRQWKNGKLIELMLKKQVCFNSDGCVPRQENKFGLNNETCQNLFRKLCSHKILKPNFAIDVFQNVADIK